MTTAPLASLEILSDAFGLSNRNTKPLIVKSIATNYNPHAIGTLVGLRRASDKKVFLIDGHHRHEGLHEYCKVNKINPSTFLVNVDIYNESDIPKGMTTAEWIDRLRQDIHTRAPETPANEIQRHWQTSPWRLPMASHGLEPRFSGNFNFNTITQARLAADAIKARIKLGDAPEVALSSFPAPVPTKVRLQAQIAYNGTANLYDTIATIILWEDTVGCISRNGANFRTVKFLTFALLVAEDKKNNHLSNPFQGIADYCVTPPGDSVPILMFKELLAYANYKKPRTSPNRVHLLGKSIFGANVSKH